MTWPVMRDLQPVLVPLRQQGTSFQWCRGHALPRAACTGTSETHVSVGMEVM